MHPRQIAGEPDSKTKTWSRLNYNTLHQEIRIKYPQNNPRNNPTPPHALTNA
jgi:hypothetical protein